MLHLIQKDVCPKHNRKLRISYNIKDIFVNFKNNNIDEETIEGLAIESFISKYNLTPEWIDERWIWGGQDENGTWLGIIGRVRIESEY